MDHKSAISNIDNIIKRNHPKQIMEGSNIALAVWNYRQYFLPPKVRLIVLAESHVFTENCCAVPLNNPHVSPIPSSYYKDFNKFFYCLGYGEQKALLTVPCNKCGGRTTGFWNLMKALTSYPNMVSNKTNPYFSSRIKNKWELLSCMRCSGIWLLDASFFAVNHIKDTNVRLSILSSQIMHVLGIINTLGAPSILMVGKNVQTLYQGLLPQIGVKKQEWIYMPHLPQYHTKNHELKAINFIKQIGLSSSCINGLDVKCPTQWEMPNDIEWDSCFSAIQGISNKYIQ